MLKQIRDLYEKNNNSFHNFEHGFTVTHASYYYIKNIGLNDYLDSHEQNILMISSLAHDIGHTGKTNAFEISSYSNLAVCYNDESVLENYHAS